MPNMDRETLDTTYRVHVGSKLDTQLTKLGLMLGQSRIWFRTYQEIGMNAPAINQARYDMVLGTFQKAAFSLLATEVYNIFDDHPEFSIISIPSILKELRDNNYSLLSPPKFSFALRSLQVNIPSDDPKLLQKAIRKLQVIRPTFRNDAALQMVEETRNNSIAHVNQEAALMPYSLPSDTNIERLVKWADDFRKTIFEGFFPNTVPEDIYDWSESHIMNTKRLIKALIGEENYIDPLELQP